METRATFGQEVERTEWTTQRDLIAAPELSPNGNLVLSVGRELPDADAPSGHQPPAGWSKIAHVVMTPREAGEFVAAIADAYGRDEASREYQAFGEVLRRGAMGELDK